MLRRGTAIPRDPHAGRTVERKIYFYLIDAGKNDDGTPLLFDPKAVLSHLAHLDPGDRYFEPRDGFLTFSWVDQLAAPYRMRLATIRRSDLPPQERGGNLSPLKLEKRAGLAEQVHIVIFGRNVLGAEFNFYGPRPPRLKPYLFDRARGICPRLSFNLLVDPEVAEALEKMGEYRSVALRMNVENVVNIKRKHGTLHAAFEAAKKVGESQEIELVLRTRRGRSGLGQRLVHAVRSLARDTDAHRAITKFRIRGRDEERGSLEWIDVLGADVVTTKRILKLDGRTRGVDSNSAYDAIVEAHEEMRDRIERAIGLGVR